MKSFSNSLLGLLIFVTVLVAAGALAQDRALVVPGMKVLLENETVNEKVGWHIGTLLSRTPWKTWDALQSTT